MERMEKLMEEWKNGKEELKTLRFKEQKDERIEKKNGRMEDGKEEWKNGKEGRMKKKNGKERTQRVEVGMRVKGKNR